jgi:hypothetical protein
MERRISFVPLRVIDRPHGGIAAAQCGYPGGTQRARVASRRRQGLQAHAHGQAYRDASGRLLVHNVWFQSLLVRKPAGSDNRNHEKLVSRARRPVSAGGPWSRFDAAGRQFLGAAKILLAHGGYDEAFRYTEDRDLAIRLWDAGVRF